LFLPSYSPNLNLIERLWKFTKRRALYGRYHPKFADFQAAIQEILDGIPTTYAEQMETLMTLNFQQFEDVSLMAAQGICRSRRPFTSAIFLILLSSLLLLYMSIPMAIYQCRH
jgi:hypothetical protein